MKTQRTQIAGTTSREPGRDARRRLRLRAWQLASCALLVLVWLSASTAAHAQTLGGLADPTGGVEAEGDPTSPAAVAARRAEVTARLEALSPDAEADPHARLIVDRLQQIDSLLAREQLLAGATARDPSERSWSRTLVPSTIVLNALLEELWLEEQEALRSAEAVDDARADLASAKERLEAAARQRRRARKALEDGEGVRAEKAAALEVAVLDELLAQERVHLRGLETRAALIERDARAPLDPLAQLIEQTRAAIASSDREGGARHEDVTASDAIAEASGFGAGGRMAARIEDEAEQRRQRDATARELATAELWLAAAEKRFAQQKTPTREQAAQVGAIRVRRDALREQLQLFDERLERVRARAEIHQRWEKLLREDPDRDQLATWEAELAAQVERLEQMSQERARQAADVEHRIEHAEAMRVKAASDSVLHASLGEQVEALHGLRRMMQSELGEIPADRRLAERYLADLDDRLGRLDPTEMLADAARSLRELWAYEITAVDDAPITVGSLVLALGLFAVGMWISRWGAATVARIASERLRLDVGAAHALQTLSFYALLVSFTLLALRAVHFPLTAFTVLGGALAIGIGFGSQNVMNNFISGLILMLERPVRARDVVEVDGSHGTIEKIGARSTQIRATDGRHLIVPNSFFLESNVVNWTLSDDLIRAKVSVGVIYGSPTRLVEELIRRVVKEDELVLKHPEPLVIFEEFGDNSLNFDTYFWVRARSPMEVRKVQSRIRFRIDEVFREHDLVIAFPQRDVHIDSTSPIEVRILDAITKTLPPGSGQD